MFPPSSSSFAATVAQVKCPIASRATYTRAARHGRGARTGRRQMTPRVSCGIYDKLGDVASAVHALAVVRFRYTTSPFVACEVPAVHATGSHSRVTRGEAP